MTNLLEYLEKTVLEFPDKCAYADENYSLTFREVYEQARSVGTALLNDGISKEPVVVFMPKEPKTITAFLGALYAGAFYVPIDEEMPKYRIELILKMLEARAVICDETSAGTIKKYGFSGKIYIYDEMICTEEDNAKLVSARNKFIDTDPAYVVFTSGSTGVPKGVVACHRSVIDYIENLSAVLQVDSDTIFGNQAPLYVDACLKEIYPTLKCGATAVIIPKQHFMFPMQLVDFLNEKRINTICWVVPALTMISSLGVLEKKTPLYLKTVAFGSEVFPVKQFNLWQKYVPDARYINLYGPTEATGMSCYYIVDRHFDENDIIPIGRPFANTDILLLDDSGKPVAQGEKGEIYIRGTSVTFGYYKQFEKTEESFVQNPLNDMYPEIVYKTGDLGYYNERGELMFASRKDYQIKHMGHRIELGEIDMAVNGCEGIESSCCVYDEEKKKICLFYTGSATQDKLAMNLKEKLPRYMLPNRYERIDRLPLTLNGKIDRKALLQWKN
jgi:amino acid adenylation domain-containing protein